MMKILLAIDGSPYSDAAVKEVCARNLPAGTQVKVLTVAHVMIPVAGDAYLFTSALYLEMLAEERKLAAERVEKARQQIAQETVNLEIETQVLEGSPKNMIIEEAERWGADLIVVGSHGYGPVHRFLLGSVSQAVALHAPCSVEIVRSRQSHDYASVDPPRG